MPSLCKHHLDTADAKRPKHHPNRKPKNWSHRAHAQPMQTPSGHCRCKKTQTPSRHEPKTAQTASQKNNLWSYITCPAYANTIWNHIKQLWSHRAHAQPMQTPSGHCRCKRPKHHLDTSRKPPKPQAKKLFHVNIKQSLEPQSTCPAYANTIWTLQMQKDPNPIYTRAENRPNRKPKNCFSLPLEST